MSRIKTKILKIKKSTVKGYTVRNFRPMRHLFANNKKTFLLILKN